MASIKGPDAAARRRLDARLDFAISLVGATPARLRELAERYAINGRMRREVLIPRVYWKMVHEYEGENDETGDKNN